MRKFSYSEAILQAIDQSMAHDQNVILIGEGVPDGIFGTTKDLHHKYPDRVFDSPLSENGVTGFCIGAALNGKRPIMVHQRADFSLLALDQIVNNAAKWYHMFGGQISVPLVIRMIIGRGWGQGPQHSQSLQSLFAAIPGLKVIMPSHPYDVKGLMIGAIHDNNPVIILEHRWLYENVDNVDETFYRLPLNEANLLRKGEDVTIVAFSYGVLESLRAFLLLHEHDIKSEIIDGVSINPLDIDTIINSVKKTGRLVVVDTAHEVMSIGAEIVRQVVEKAFGYLKSPPIVLGSKNYPQPTSQFLIRDYYTDGFDIANTCLKMFEKELIDKPFVDPTLPKLAIKSKALQSPF